jgi:hypothetical protein
MLAILIELVDGKMKNKINWCPRSLNLYFGLFLGGIVVWSLFTNGSILWSIIIGFLIPFSMWIRDIQKQIENM